jgi:metal-responsive CopG/Arc/MetJ family transcriptional regulator
VGENKMKFGCVIVYVASAKAALDQWYYHGYTSSMKTAISIPDQVFKAAEALASRLGISRSELYAKAVESYVKDIKNQGVTDRLNSVYITEDNSLDEAYSRLQLHSLTKDNW